MENWLLRLRLKSFCLLHDSEPPMMLPSEAKRSEAVRLWSSELLQLNVASISSSHFLSASSVLRCMPVSFVVRSPCGISDGVH